MTKSAHSIPSLALAAIFAVLIGFVASPANALVTKCVALVRATETGDLGGLHDLLETKLKEVDASSSGGLGLFMWLTAVDRDGRVCAVVFSGPVDRGDQWPASRAISAQKAYTANSLSLPGFALSTANLFSATQPGGSLWGLATANPMDTDTIYDEDRVDDIGMACAFTNGDVDTTVGDPMCGLIPGGTNVFGGGLALYTESGFIIGAIGVSGDTSCTDHTIAWKVRDEIGLDNVPGGVADGGTSDNIIYDITGSHNNFASKSGFGHSECAPPPNPADPDDLIANFPLGP